ncbi:MAG TPA: fused MFS/spermidine synthase [Bryobacteraceae bacterium]|nr:fused MFS/spermidine synthase [Bryobacteraceae bacterium]
MQTNAPTVSVPAPATAILPYYTLFFISGFPALIYQIVWQRTLFAIYGVNIESVTIIVTVFMLGLGFGSLTGGRLSKVHGLPILGAFGAIEIGIGLFGAVSLPLFGWASTWTAGASAPVTALVTLCLLLIPTLLMGSTLPLLVAHSVRATRNIGESVGLLYSVNTLGSSLACLATGFFLMSRFGQSGSVRIAALLNVFVGCSALLLSRSTPMSMVENFESLIVSKPSGAASFRAGLALSFVTGLISLGYEMVWYRVYSFTSGSVAPVFAILLGCYLAGIAFGSFVIHDLCTKKLRDNPEQALRLLGGIIIWGGVVSFLVAPVLASAVRILPLLITFPLVMVGASLLGAAFPLVSHIGIRPTDQAGSKLSYLYIANIIGSAAGSFVVGFILMDYLSLRSICLCLLGMAVLSAGALLGRTGHRLPGFVSTGALAALVIALLSPQLFSKLYEKLLYKERFPAGLTFRHVVETRSGVIAVSQDGTAYGGGVYDGRFNTDLLNDTNGLFRPFAISSFHPHPAEVLMIGLASGSWAQIIANNPAVRHFDIIEINPGYLPLIEQYPMVSSILRNPKVQITIDDGRRWLHRNPHKNFDLIVMNTTYSWRAHASNLLSLEFLDLARRHLNPGGILFYNTTFSRAALLTGASAFPFSLRVFNFLAVSDGPISIDKQRWSDVLAAYNIDKKPVFDLNDETQRKRFDEVLSLADTLYSPQPARDIRMELGDDLRRRLQGTRLITDDNMGDEWH